MWGERLVTLNRSHKEFLKHIQSNGAQKDLELGNIHAALHFQSIRRVILHDLQPDLT